MSGEEKDKSQAERIVEFSEALMGDIDQTDDCEAEEIYQEFGQGKNPASAIRELAAKAAQKYRLANRAVPLHVQLALDATGPKDLNSMNRLSLKTIVGKVLSPTHTSVHSAMPAYRNRKDLTGEDKRIVEELSSELEEPWEEGNLE
jgi:hypothetical protein